MSQASPARIGRKGRRYIAGAQTPLQHALVELHDLDRAGLAGLAEMRLERNHVERHEAEDQLADLAGGAQQADVRAAVRHQCEILHVGAHDLADQGHRLAACAPAADADRHAVAQLGDHVGGRHSLVHLDSDL